MNRWTLTGLVGIAVVVAGCAPGGRNCGDRFCDARFETALSCPGDCGGAVCGDRFCDAGETAGSCPSDCGSCGDGLCHAAISETCSSCPTDCGTCTATCGDGACRASDGETCSTCVSDCGACGGTAEPYDACGGTTTCRLSRDSCTAITNGSATRSMCTTSCSSDADCDSDMFDAQGDCVFYGGAGTCFHRCVDSSDCYPGFACYVPTGSTGAIGNICLPDAGPPVPAAAYERCSDRVSSSDCAAGLECINYMVSGATANLCSVSGCFGNAECPFDSRGGRGACLTFSGLSSCWERCRGDFDCLNTVDFACRDIGGSPTPVLVCVPR
jgi:hypothetical protein